MTEFGAVLWEDGGPAGVARHLEFLPTLVDQRATIATYELIAHPPQHPLWHRYLMSVIHLRPIDGQQHPVTISTPGATHEVMIFALDPSRDVEQFITGFYPLYPPNVVTQLVIPLTDPDEADRCAINVLRMAARGFITGHMVVEDGGRTLSDWWHEVLTNTIEHEIHGGHPS